MLNQKALKSAGFLRQHNIREIITSSPSMKYIIL